MTVNAGSFRDPAGRIFEKDGEIYRSVFEQGAVDFEAARDAGVYDQLIKSGLLIPHEEVDFGNSTPENTIYSETSAPANGELSLGMAVFPSQSCRFDPP